MAKMSHKPFVTQLRECADNGTRKEISNVYGTYPETILLCTKYLEICSSNVCRKDRRVK